MSAPINDGGPAFPSETEWGMTLRDYFAAAAINEVGWYNNINQSAIMAYEIADAMLKARKAKPWLNEELVSQIVREK
jgi:hypothetical protein